MKGFDPETMSPSAHGRVLKSCVAPRPIAWISTAGEDGTPNLAPFSCYNYVSPSPPVVMFNASAAGDGTLKDTPRNALQTGEFAINVATESFLEPMDRTSEPLPPGANEFDDAAVEMTPCETISAPRVAGAVACMECELYDSIRIHDRVMVMGEVRHFLVSESILTDGQVDATKLALVGRLGGPYYTRVEPLDRTAHLL